MDKYPHSLYLTYSLVFDPDIKSQSAHEEKSLYGTFILSPWDKELDWSFEARAAPCYVTVGSLTFPT